MHYCCETSIVLHSLVMLSTVQVQGVWNTTHASDINQSLFRKLAVN